jgi:hypothetical protein
MIFDLAFIVRFFLIALAVYRLAWMFTRENGPFALFDKFRMWLGKHATEGKGLGWTLAELFNCPHCLGLWLAFLASPAVLWPSRGMDIILMILAIAGLQSLLTDRSDT